MGSHFDVLDGQFRFEVFITQVMSLLMLGGLLAYLAERERRLQSESLAIKCVLQKADPEASINETLEDVLGAILKLFGASHVFLALKGLRDDRAFAWKAGGDGIASRRVECKELEASELGRHFFPMPGKSWSLQRSNRTKHYRILALDDEGRRLEKVSCSIPEHLFSNQPFRSLLAVDFRLREEWAGRIFLFDVRNGKGPESNLRFFQGLIGEVAPVVHSAYLLRRMRTRARSSERARIARDLHDGVIQSLIAMEMRVDVLRRQAAGVSSGAAEKLENVRDLLRQEVISLRELMQQLRFDDVAPQQLLTCVADIVDRFQRETGIEARFSSDAQTAAMPPRVSREVACIVHEALANVRKHSGARNVQVRLGSEQGLWKLVIEDDGHGFEFSGRLSLSELDLARKGPRVIKERVHCIKGELAIDSHPSQGARLEVSFASKAYG
ncbi:MAG: sensor histidine kinase [Terriglobia bacterium]